MISVMLFKMGKHCDFHLNFFQIVGARRNFTVVTKLMKNFKSYMVLGDAVSKLETFVSILNRISRPITWSLFTLKASSLVKWSISTWSFMGSWQCRKRPSKLTNRSARTTERYNVHLHDLLDKFETCIRYMWLTTELFYEPTSCALILSIRIYIIETELY